MKLLQLILLNVLLFSCAGKPLPDEATGDTITVVDNPVKDSFPTGKIIEQVICKADASQSYALYIPSANAKAVIYFFDPHADGALPLKKYEALADSYNYILIGSNNSKNGNDWQTTESIWQNLFNDTKSRIDLNADRMYTCGFSGGAKVAGYITLHHPQIKAVIAGGAGLPDETLASNFNFSFTGIAGKGDMNMTDLISLNNALDKTTTNHRLIFFNGKHEWAPGSTMSIVFAGLALDAMRNKNVQKNDSLINAFISNSKQRIVGALQQKDFVQASDECILSINMLNGLTDVKWFSEKNNSIQTNTAYKTQLQLQQQLFTLEENKKEEYNVRFQNGDINYWNSTINELNAKAKGTTPQAAMHQRLLAYLSLAFYSISNQLISHNENKTAAYFITLYKLADPSNSEAWYFSALINARNNNTNAASDDLLKAIENGFKDAKRMRLQPEFQRLQSPVNFDLLEAKMRQK